MAYAEGNPKTKKALKERVAAGEKVRVFSPGPFRFPAGTVNMAIEGPHYPEPHKWYAEAVVKDGVIVSVK